MFNIQKKKIPFIFLKSILFFVPLLITSCVGGGITLNSTDGSKIKFKGENVTCKIGIEYPDILNSSGGGLVRNVECTANGVRTYLNGFRANFTDTKLCKVINSKGEQLNNQAAISNLNSFACLAATKLRKIK